MSHVISPRCVARDVHAIAPLNAIMIMMMMMMMMMIDDDLVIIMTMMIILLLIVVVVVITIMLLLFFSLLCGYDSVLLSELVQYFREAYFPVSACVYGISVNVAIVRAALFSY